jgi:hypothetical protein
MTAMHLSGPKAKAVRGVVVDRPRASDAIGDALRGAFDRDNGLPADMMRLLRKIDRTRS